MVFWSVGVFPIQKKKVVYPILEVAVVDLVNKPVIAIVQLILRAGKEDLAIGHDGPGGFAFAPDDAGLARHSKLKDGIAELRFLLRLWSSAVDHEQRCVQPLGEMPSCRQHSNHSR